MKSVKVHEAKTHFSKLLTLVEAGEEVLVKRGDTPVAKIVPYVAAGRRDRVFGALKGQIRIADDFDEIPPEFDEYLV